MTIVLFYRLDRAYCEVADDATAFSGGRSPRYGVFMIGGVPEPEMFAAERTGCGRWQRRWNDAAGDSSYVNGSTEFDAVVDAYGAGSSLGWSS